MVTRTSIILATAAMAAMFIAAPAGAQLPGGETRTVSYADLNLATAAGAAALRHRIAAAVAEVCGYSEGVTTLREQLEVRKCSAKAEAEANQHMAPILSDHARLAAAR